MRGTVLTAAFALFAGSCMAQVMREPATAPTLQQVRSTATETWDCKWTNLGGPASAHFDGVSVVQVVGATVYWELPAPTASGWTLRAHILIEDDKRALVAVVSSTANDDIPSSASHPIGATAFLIDKANGHFRMGSVMDGGSYILMDGHCEQKTALR